MYRNRTIAVVIPCFQVGKHIHEVVTTLPDFVDHVIVVDDGSRDTLHEELQRTSRPGIVVLKHDTNLGLARAMVTGFRKAIALGADIIAKVDGDGQMDPAELVRLLRPIIRHEADFTKGNRFVRRRHLEGMPRVRLVGNLGLSFLTKWASGYWNIFDPTNGYVVMRREVVEEIDLDRLGPGYFFETSLLAEAYLAGAVIRDVSIPSRYGSEESSLSPTRILLRFPGLLVAAGLRRIVIRYFLRDFTPVALFLMIGLLMMGFGVVFGAREWMLRYGSGVPTPTGTILIAVLPLLAGFELLLQAVVMDIANVPQHSAWPESAEERATLTVMPRDIPGEASQPPMRNVTSQAV